MKQRLFLYLSFLFSVCFLSAQAKEKDEFVILKIGDDTLHTEIQKAFEAFQGPLYSDPGLPAFTLVSKNNRIAAGIGGYVRFTTSFDFGGIVPSRDFVTSLIPVPSSSAQRSQFNMDASTSRIFLRLLADTKSGILQFFVETDFRGFSDRNRFTAIYASLNGWRLGRYWSVLADLESYPPSVDFQGPNSFAGTSTYQISYQGNLNKHISIGVGLEMPEYSIADSLARIRLPQRIPSLPFYIQYQTGLGHLRVGSILRPLLYRNTISNHTEYAFTWGVVGSATLKLVSKTNFYFQTVFGKGIGNYTFELNGMGLDLISDGEKSGKLKAARLWGAFAGVQHEFTSFFQASAIYSQLRLLDNNIPDPDLYKIGQYLVFTGYFNLTPRMQLAIEYDFGRLDLKNRRWGSANRMIGMIRYDF